MSRLNRRRRNAAAALVLAGLAAGFPSGAAAQLPTPVESEPIPFDPAIVLSICDNADFTGISPASATRTAPSPT